MRSALKPLRKRALLPAVAWMMLLCACDPKGQSTDMAHPADMTMASTGPNCGKIILCSIECGLDKSACSSQCAMGASLTEATKAGALAICALTHCFDRDGGEGTASILICLLTSCKTEVSACDGLPF